MAANSILIHEVIRILEKNVCILKEEHYLDFDLKYRDKLERFRKLSDNVTDKLQSLLHLSENYTCASNSLKQFVIRIETLRSSFIKQICEKCSEFRMNSQTLSGVPLSLLLQKIKKQTFVTRELLYTHKDEYDSEYLEKCHSLIHEIEKLLSYLDRCDDKLQYYVVISKLIPYFVKLESGIDTYVSAIKILPIMKSECTDLDAFAIVAKLLTGELLDSEYMNPYHVLADNAPRKPVCIIKTKRRTDIPTSI